MTYIDVFQESTSLERELKDRADGIEVLRLLHAALGKSFLLEQDRGEKASSYNVRISMDLNRMQEARESDSLVACLLETAAELIERDKEIQKRWEDHMKQYKKKGK